MTDSAKTLYVGLWVHYGSTELALWLKLAIICLATYML